MKFNKQVVLEKVPQTDEEQEQGILGFVVTVAKVDRDRELLDPKTMDVTPFATTGSLTLFHSHSEFPIGYPVRIMAEDDRIRTWIKFDLGDADDIEKRAQTAYNKVLHGSLVTASLEALSTPKTIGEVVEDGPDDWHVEYKYLALTGLTLCITPANDSAAAINTNRMRCTIDDARQKSVEFSDFTKQIDTVHQFEKEKDCVPQS